jgi:hypothetical protein
MIKKYIEFINEMQTNQCTDVNVFVGDLTAITNKHIEMFDNIYKDCGLKTFIISNNPSFDVNDPLATKLVTTTLNALTSNVPSVLDYSFDNGSIEIKNVLGILNARNFMPKSWVFLDDEDSYANNVRDHFATAGTSLCVPEIRRANFSNFDIQQLLMSLTTNTDLFMESVPPFVYCRINEYIEYINKHSLFASKYNKINEAAKVGYAIFPIHVREMFNEDSAEAYKIIREYYRKYKIAWDAPISLNPKFPKKFKLRRSLKTQHFKNYVKALGLILEKDTSNKFKTISIDWGDGSRGGTGVFSKGFSFETNLENDFKRFISEGLNSEEFFYKDLITELVSEFNLTKATEISIKDTSVSDIYRPLIFTGESVRIATNDAAAKISDLTLTVNDSSKFLSLKYGNTISFFNIGVQKVFNPKEIAMGEITNKYGLSLLKTFNVDNLLFCRVFNDYSTDVDFREFHSKHTPTDEFQEFLKSGFGIDYTMIHLKTKGFKVETVNSNFLDKNGKILGNVLIRYGGANGKSKRVDLVFETIEYNFLLSIRNKQGGLYPSHIICNYSPKKV